MDWYTGPGKHIRFEEDLWGGQGSARTRSRELSPQYLTRYRAVRGRGLRAVSQGWEFSCIVAGRGQLQSVPNVELVPGTVYLVPPGLEHGESSDGVLESLWMGLAGTLVPASTWEGPRSVISPELVEQFEQAWRLAQRRDACVGLELDGLARAILGGFGRLSSAQRAPREEQLVQEGIRLMYVGFASPISIGKLAGKLSCSVGYFHRAFRRVTEMSPAAYLARIRVQHALLWLESTDWTIAEVATKVGYDDALYFSRVIRKAIGMSPSQFRARVRS